MNNNKEVNYEIVKFIDNNFELDVNVSPNEDTVWLTQDDIATLFDSSRSTITYHINKIYEDNELVEESTSRKIRRVQFEGNRKINREIKIYNLDMIISVGFRTASKRAIIFRIWANNVLKKYLYKGYIINENRVTVSNENYIELTNKVASIDNRLLKVENSLKENSIQNRSILFNGEFYDAYTLLEQIFEKANSEIILMNNYIDRSILDRLTSKKKGVKVTIYTSFNKSRITQNDINAFNIQYPTAILIETLNLHDRYIVIDGIKLYHVGTSIKDAGKKIFSIHDLEPSLINILLSRL